MSKTSTLRQESKPWSTGSGYVYLAVTISVYDTRILPVLVLDGCCSNCSTVDDDGDLEMDLDGQTGLKPIS